MKTVTSSAALQRIIALVFILSGAVWASAQLLDQNGNSMSDVWEWVYSATGLNPNADSDGDGFSNLQEALAGTNPFDPNSIPKIAAPAVAGTNRSITMPAQLGKFYQLQSITNLSGTNWLTETSTVVRAGTNFTFPSPVNSAMKFYRVVISDTNLDGGRLSDWEKYKLGLDVSNAMSNATMDNNGVALTDYQYATNKLASQNVITIAATDPVTVQPDPSSSPTDLGVFTVSRGGFPMNSITVSLTTNGPGVGFAAPGVDYSNNLPSSITLPAGASSATISVAPLANTNLQMPVIVQMKLLFGANYTVGSPSNASVVIYPSATANGRGLFAQYFTNSSTTYSSTNNFNPLFAITNRIDPAIDFVWGNVTNPPPNLSNGVYCVRWTGQVEPQYSENYFFDLRTDDGCKLWVNDLLLIDKWQSQGTNTEWTNAIVLQAATQYNIKLEYLQTGGKAEAHLFWYSASQPKQIIPSNRFFPTNSFGNTSSNAPAVVTSALSAIGFVGQPFSFTVTGANTPLGFTAKGLPPGLAFNSTSGLINGTPTLAGDYQVALTASNAIGTGASVVDILIYATNYSSVVQEIWAGVGGTNITDIPVNTSATLTNTLLTLEGITNYGDNYGERVRGYFIAPTTANYYFWIAGSDSAELWISNDGESVNKVRRCLVTPTNNPTTSGQNGTSPRQWNLQPSQRSPWLAMVAGQKYYLEILHKSGIGTNDNWSVGWLQDPTGTNTAPAGVAPNHLLARYYPPLPVTIPGTLYTATMLAQSGAASSGVGTATLRVSADGTQAVLKRNFSGLSSALTGEHIHCDPYLNSPSQIMFDIDAATPQADGSYVWNIAPVGTLSAADILEIIREGKAYINIHTANYPGGEINGHFSAVNGSQTFTPPPAAQSWADDHSNSNAAARFLIQATFGASSNDIVFVQSLGYDGWISNQFVLPVSHHLSNVLANVNSDPTTPYPGTMTFNTWWQQSVTAPDQLRQRVAFALSEIMVISQQGVLQDNARALSDYYDVLLDDAFGNFRQLLEDVTLTPAMGLYLDMRNNDKGNFIFGTHANENYAREINQLFSVGLNRLWSDGTLVLNSQGNLVPTYDQNVINGFAADFTGWNYYQTNQANGRLPTSFGPSANYTNPMVLVPTHHDLGTKRLLDNVMLPAAWGNQTVSSTSTNDDYCSQDLEKAMDNIFNNQNVGPFVCRQLIQRLVTSNPSRDYLYRVVQKFNDNGSGVRGDLQAVIKAILLDYEARSTNVLALSTYGKQREPLLRVTAMARAFPSPPPITGTYVENGGRSIMITTATTNNFNSGDSVFISYTDTSSNTPPSPQAYSVTVTNRTVFSINAPGMTTGTYGQSGNVISVTNASHGLSQDDFVYLAFTTGGASNGIYHVDSAASSSVFSVTTSDFVTRTGVCVIPRWTGGGFTKTGTNILMSIAGNHGLSTNDSVFINFSPGAVVSNAIYQVVSVPDAMHFVIVSTNTTSQTDNNPTNFPLVAPPLVRSGTVTIQSSTWTMNATDAGTTSSLSETPLNSPTVFNFYFPDYKFAGQLASAALTTPEFQLTSDTSVVLQMNFLAGGFLTNSPGNPNNTNTNGLSSFTGGDGDIVLDISPWMTTNYTASAGVTNLVDGLNTLLVAGQLSTRAKTNIIAYVNNTTNFPGPTNSLQMRDRVRAVVHLITASPDFTIQK